MEKKDLIDVLQKGEENSWDGRNRKEDKIFSKYFLFFFLNIYLSCNQINLDKKQLLYIALSESIN